jgi:hypothetical protein
MRKFLIGLAEKVSKIISGFINTSIHDPKGPLDSTDPIDPTNPNTKGDDTMASNNLSQTYDDYIKGIQTLKPEEQLSLIKAISASLKKTFRGKKAKHSVMELEGLGADIWKGVDAQEYVLKERNSWD